MTLLTESELFERTNLPLTVRDQTTVNPAGPTTAEAVRIVFGISGWARLEAPAAQVGLEAGTLLFVPFGMECSEFPHGHSRTVTFFLRQEYLATGLRWLPHTNPMVRLLARTVRDTSDLAQLHLPSGSMRQLGPCLARVAQLDATGHDELAVLSTAAQIADFVGRFAGATRPPPEGRLHVSMLPRRDVAVAVAILRRHPEHAWTVDSLANHVALSTSQLTRAFRQQIGLSPSAYLRQVRVDRMAEMLATRHLDIAEAARAVGWDNPVVAARAFKRRYGTSPRSFATSVERGSMPREHD